MNPDSDVEWEPAEETAGTKPPRPAHPDAEARPRPPRRTAAKRRRRSASGPRRDGETGSAPQGGDPSGAAAPSPAEDGEAVRRTDLIPSELLDERAVFVVKKLQREGHEAYLVGGCVRDLLAGLEPKDFDLATDARPNRIKRLFRSARVIGRRFRLVHIRFPGDHVIETATFRGDPSRLVPTEAQDERNDGQPDGDGQGRRRNWRDSVENVFGTAPEDARRRDFTVNALFYDPVRDEVVDWVGGLADMKRGLIRSIGDPGERILEDPVRMLRAVHFAHRLDFKLEPELEQAIRTHAGSLADASQARLYIELVKMLSRGCARETFHHLHELGVLRIWLPELADFLDEPVTWPERTGGTHAEARRGEPVDTPAGHATWNLLGAADRFGLAAHRTPESLALAVLFGPWLLSQWRRSGEQGFGAFVDQIEETFRPVALRMSVPRWASTQLRDILWMLDDLREAPPEKRAPRFLWRPSFPVALAFYELDLGARAQDDSPAEQWRQLALDNRVALSYQKPAQQGRRGGQRGRGRGERSKRGGRNRRHRGGGGRPQDSGRPEDSEQPQDSGRPRSTPEPEAGAWMPPPE